MYITPKEAMVLDAILHSDYCDGDPIDNPVWSFSCNPFDDLKSLGGVMASLKKKQLVGTDGDGDDATCWITPQGYTFINDVYSIGLPCRKCAGMPGRDSCLDCQGCGYRHVDLKGDPDKRI